MPPLQVGENGFDGVERTQNITGTLQVTPKSPGDLDRFLQPVPKKRVARSG